MSLKIDRVQLEIAVGNDKARLRLRELENEVKKNTLAMKRLKRVGKENTEEYKQLEQQTKELRIEQDKLIEGIGLNSLSMKELTQRSRELRAILSNLDPNTHEWKEYSAQLQKVNARMGELRASSAQTKTSIQKMADSFNRYESIFTWFTAALIGVIYTVKEFVQSISDMSDVMGEVMKTTGLTLNEVRELKQEFKTFETRTASKELLNIAYQAGKLGLKTKEEIKGFVQEADIAVVSLGKALGNNAEETINTLGKIIGAFQLEQTMGWEKAMRHTAAVVNELGKRSTASEDAIVNYMARLASVGVSLKIPMENIAGIGATLDSLKVPAEQGSTAVQKFLFTIASESDKLSKFLGVTKQEYQRMVEEDITDVMLMLLRTANSGNDGLFKMVQQLDAMDVTGVRMINTVSQMINNVDKLDNQMGIAAEEFERGTSTLNEFNIMNNTFAARMAKVRKEVAAVVYGLGMKLEPVIVSLAEGFASALKWLQKNVSTLAFLGKITLVATTALVSYTAAIKLSALWTKRQTALEIANRVAKNASAIATGVYMAATNLLAAAKFRLTGNISQATFAMKSFNTITRMNPVGLLIAALTTAISLYIAFRDETEKASEATKILGSVHEISASRFEEASGKLENYRQALIRTKPNSQERIDMVKRLNEIYPKLLENIDAENAGVKALSAAFKSYSENLRQTIQLRVLSDEYGKTYTDERDLIRQRDSGELDTDEFYAEKQLLLERRKALQDKMQYQSDLVMYNKEVADLLQEKRELEKNLNRPSQVLADELNESVLSYAEFYKAQMAITGKGKLELEGAYAEYVESVKQENRELMKNTADLIKGSVQQMETLDFDTWFDNQAEMLTAHNTLFEKEYSEYLKNATKARSSADKEKQRLIKINEELDAYFNGTKAQKENNRGVRDSIKQKKIKVVPSDLEDIDALIQDALDASPPAKKNVVVEIKEEEEELPTVNLNELRENFTYLQSNKKKLESLQDIHQQQEAYQDSLLATRSTLEQINELYGIWMDRPLTEDSSTEEIEAAYQRIKELQQKNLEQEYWSELWKKSVDGRKAFLEGEYNSGIISFAEYQDKLTQIEKEKTAERKKISELAMNSASKLLSAQSNFYQAAMNSELATAGDNEKSKDAIRKKYARKQQQVDIAQAMISHAKGVLSIWEKFAWNPPAAIALTAVETAYTGSQIALIRSQQFAKGRDYYDVMGEDDGRTYKKVPFIGEAKTGIRNRPALISEKGSEGIIDHKTLFSPKRNHMGMTAMDHFRAITNLKYGVNAVPQYAEGKYTAVENSDNNRQSTGNSTPQYATLEDIKTLYQVVQDSNTSTRQMIVNLNVKADVRQIEDEKAKYVNISSKALGEG